MFDKFALFWWRLCFASGLLFWTGIFLLVAGCTTSGRSYDSRYFYQEDIQDWVIAYAENQANIEILPWEAFRKRVWAMGCEPNAIACTKGFDIVIQAGLSFEQCRESLWHELGHWEDALSGKLDNGHSGNQWGSRRPEGYDAMVQQRMAEFC